jgi:hypothetical protein
VGSFEKGEIFGLPRVIANVNMTAADRNFHNSELYTQNIRPFLQEKDETEFFDFKTGSLAFALDSHPLRKLLIDALSATKIPLTKAIPITELSGLTLHAPSHEDLRKLDAIVNRSLRNINFENLPSLSATEIRALVESIHTECKRRGLLHAYTYTVDATDLPSASGRKKLQRCLQRLDVLNNTSNRVEQH